MKKVESADDDDVVHTCTCLLLTLTIFLKLIEKEPLQTLISFSFFSLSLSSTVSTAHTHYNIAHFLYEFSAYNTNCDQPWPMFTNFAHEQIHTYIYMIFPLQQMPAPI